MAVQDGKTIRQHDLNIRVLGDLSLLPAPVRTAAEKVMMATSGNRGPVLNICFAYS